MKAVKPGLKSPKSIKPEVSRDYFSTLQYREKTFKIYDAVGY